MSASLVDRNSSSDKILVISTSSILIWVVQSLTVSLWSHLSTSLLVEILRLVDCVRSWLTFKLEVGCIAKIISTSTSTGNVFLVRWEWPYEFIWLSVQWNSSIQGLEILLLIHSLVSKLWHNLSVLILSWSLSSSYCESLYAIVIFVSRAKIARDQWNIVGCRRLELWILSNNMGDFSSSSISY